MSRRDIYIDPKMTVDELCRISVRVKYMPDPGLWNRLRLEADHRIKMGVGRRDDARLKGVIRVMKELLGKESDELVVMTQVMPARIAMVRVLVDGGRTDRAVEIAAALCDMQKTMNQLGGEIVRKALLAERLGSREAVQEFIRKNRASIRELIRDVHDRFGVRIDRGAVVA